MTINIFHQCGHNSNWNIDSYTKDKCGSGLILSPVHHKMEQINKLDSELKKNCFFDPQYYLPNSQKIKLNSYDFFPEKISGGYTTADFSLLALESARKCVGFQTSQDFFRVIIPARHFSEMTPDFIEKQDKFTVHPFLQAIDEAEYSGEVFLTVPITTSMLIHNIYRTDLLNWMTNYPRIDGIYLLVEDDRNTKQIKDFNFLTIYLKTVKELIDIGLKVTVGHTNTESILFSLIDDCEITLGAYENTRKFSIDKFIASEDGPRGPKARIYLPGLYNWILFSQAKQIKDGLDDVWNNIYFPTHYAKSVFSSAGEPHFSNPQLYKHYFLSYQEQINELAKLDINDRYQLLKKNFKNSIDYYDEITEWPLDLDIHGKGDHIQTWLDVINWYYREFISTK